MSTTPFRSLHRSLPPYARGAAKIIQSMYWGHMGSDLQVALQSFDQDELTGLAMSWISYCDPYKAPEQVAPCAEAIARFFVNHREEEKANATP